MAGKSRQPSHESPRRRRKNLAPVTLIKQRKERERQGRGDSLQGVPTLRRNANAKKTLIETPKKRLTLEKR